MCRPRLRRLRQVLTRTGCRYRALSASIASVKGPAVKGRVVQAPMALPEAAISRALQSMLVAVAAEHLGLELLHARPALLNVSDHLVV